MVRRLFHQIASLFRRRSLDRDLQDELETHLTLAADDYERRGHPPHEARRMARLAIGGEDNAFEAHRDARGLPSLENLWRDAKYALRGFRREPAMVTIAVLILAIGIGANTAVFSIVNPMLLRPLPFKNPEQLVWIANTGTTGSLSATTFRVDWYEQFQKTSQSFEEISAYFAFFGYAGYTLTGRGEPERLSAVDVAPRFFEVLGVSPAYGRSFSPDEHRASGPRAAILTHGLWQRRFNGDPAIVGQSIVIDNAAMTVVGVMPDTFDFSSIFTPGTSVDFFIAADLEQMRPWGNTLAPVGRLRPGVTLERAKAEFETLIPALQEAHKDWGRVGAQLSNLKTQVTGSMREPLLVLWSTVGVVLLIVCANLANLLLARASSRGREFAVRLALGASRSRLVRQLLTEGVLLSLAGALVGVPLAYGLTSWVASTEAVSVPLLRYARVDVTALLVTAAIACVTGLMVALIPAMKVSAQGPQAALQDHSRGSIDSARHTWVRRALVVGEIALAAILLTGAGLLTRSFVRLINVNVGFEPSRAVAARVDFPREIAPERRAALSLELRRKVQALPGIEGAGLTDALPLARNRTWGIRVPEKVYRPEERLPNAFVYVVSPGYLGAMGIAIKAGRDFADHDSPPEGKPFILINETLARQLYPGEDAVGRRALVGRSDTATIIGVVADVRQTGLDEAPAGQFYLDLARGGGSGDELIMRTTLPAESLAQVLRATVAGLDASLLVSHVRGLESLVDRAVSPRRFLISLVGAFSVLAVVLASLGIYGVVSYGVNQRRAEIGVRMALGATGPEVRRQVLGETLRLSFLGVALGLGAALLMTRVVESLLFATSPNDPATFVATAGILTVVALAAGYIPALRASRLDAMRALRAE